MELSEIYQKAGQRMEGYCRVCNNCNGVACRGEVPGMGGAGTARSFQANVEAWKDYKLAMRTIHQAKDPSTVTNIFGLELDFPVIKAPVTGNTYNLGGYLSEKEYAEIVVTASKEAGTIAMTGDGADPNMYNSGLEAIELKQGYGIPIIKPRSQEEIIKRIRWAEDAGAKAIGVDIDGAGLITMALKGQPVGPKSLSELKEIIDSTSLPFILKGIMTVDEAKLAVEAGASAIVVSNHGGRVLDSTLGTATVLAEIAEAVGKDIKILVDGGIRSGVDILKALALGADTVLVGRPLIIAAYGGGEEGFKKLLNKLRVELKKAMILTGVKSVGEINKGILVKNN